MTNPLESTFREKALTGALLFSAVASATLSASAQERSSMEEVVVTAAGFEQALVDAPASISVVTSEELAARSYTNVLDAIRNVPGIAITNSSEGQDISMRGMPSSYTMILVDGKPVSTRESRPNGSSGFEQDWLPPLNTIERIEVVRGPMSTLYGSDAMGGVINIITRKVPQEWRGSLTYQTTIQENSRSGDSRQLDFNTSGVLVEDKLGIMIYGQRQERDEDRIVDGASEKNLDSLNGRLTFTPFENHSFDLEAKYKDQKRYGHMGLSKPTSDCGRSGCSDSESWNTERTYGLSHTGDWGIATSNSYLQLEVAKNHGRDIEITNKNFKTSWVVPLDTHVLSAGLEAIKEELQDNTTNRISDRTYIDNMQKALFVEDSWSIVEDFSLTYGARLNDADTSETNISPRVYGVWNLSDQWTLKGGLSTGFVAPSLREVTPDWGATSRGGNVYGNPNLKPETSKNTELGLHYLGDRLNASVTVYNNDFEDKITRVQCPVAICPDGPNAFGSLPTYRINVDEAETQGAEFSLDTTLGENLDVAFSYTFSDSEQKSGDAAGEPLTDQPRHQLSLNLDHYASNGTRSWIQANYRGKENTLTTEGAPGYTMVDAGISYPLMDSVNLKVGVYNLLDKQITEELYGRIEDGRRYWLAVNLDF